MKVIKFIRNLTQTLYRRNKGVFAVIFLALLISFGSMYILSHNFKNFIISESQDKAKDTAILVAQLLEEDYENYGPLNAVNDFETETYDRLYLRALQSKFQGLKQQLGMTYLYSLKAYGEDSMMYVIDADLSSEATYMAPGSTEKMDGAWLQVLSSTKPGIIGLDDYGEYGELFSGYAPIHNPATQEIVGYVEVDYTVEQASSVFSQTIFYSILTALVLFSISMAALFFSFWRIRSKDELTNLSNRDAAQKKLDTLINRKQIEGLMMISLDNFKNVNNTFGQDIGDKVLKMVAMTLKSTFGSHLVYRYEGDVFLLICTKGDNSLMSQAARIEALFAHVWTINAIKVTLSASSGLLTKDFIHSPKDALFYLEHCVSLSKQKNRGKITEMTPAIYESIVRQDEILESLKRHVEERSFEVFYQPIFDVKNHSFRHAEALLRMKDEKLGYVSPSEFIPLAEKSGLIVDMGYIVLEKVCQFMLKMDEGGILYDAISVNLSLLQLADNHLLENVVAILKRYPIEVKKLRFEITESSFVGNYGPIKKLMNDLSKRGIQFYLDDFGTGYSNLAVINRLNFEAIKLDRSLLESSSQYRGNELLGGFIKIFTDFGKQVIMEGVETEAQQTMVENFGVQYIQGYRFARPVPEAEVMHYFSCRTDLK